MVGLHKLGLRHQGLGADHICPLLLQLLLLLLRLLRLLLREAG